MSNDKTTLSIHDNLLVSYEVQCEARKIVLRTEHRRKNEDPEAVSVVFEGVQGYRFENDAFGNIMFGLEKETLEEFLAEFGGEIEDSYKTAGSPGPWAADLQTALEYLKKRGIQAFLLSSSYGLSGWILAHSTAILAAT